jgi:hypothetical protein
MKNSGRNLVPYSRGYDDEAIPNLAHSWHFDSVADLARKLELSPHQVKLTFGKVSMRPLWQFRRFKFGFLPIAKLLVYCIKCSSTLQKHVIVIEYCSGAKSPSSTSCWSAGKAFKLGVPNAIPLYLMSLPGFSPHGR